MKCLNDIAIGVRFLAVGALLLLWGGCSGSSTRTAETDVQAAAETPDTTPPLTPAEKEREYETAYKLGVELASKGQYAYALQAFEEALKQKPTSVEALFNLGACHEAVGDPLRAINIYRQVLEVYPDDPDCYANLGTSFIKMYYRDRSPMWRKMARDAWQHSLTLKPDQPRVREFLAKAESSD
jgi:Flp pilus assembly protein TadD